MFSFLITGANAQAADFRVGTTNNGSVNIKQGEVVKNLYSAGNIISIDADVEKGVHAAGNVITINGDVGHSACVVGGTVITKGNIGGSVHSAGGNILIESNIEDDLILAGGNISISDQAIIGGDLIIGGGTIDLQGVVMGNVYLAGGVITINGEVGGNVKIQQVEELKLGSNALINGNFEYASRKIIEMEDGATILGEVIVNEIKGVKDIDKGVIAGILFAIISIGLLIKVIGLIIFGSLFIYFFRKFTEDMVKNSLSNFWKNLGTGFAFVILTPFVVILLFSTIIGIWVATVLIILFALMTMISGSLAGLTFGSWLNKVFKDEKKYIVDYKILAIGVVSLTIVGLVPIIGWLVVLVFMLINLGALYQAILKIK